MKDSANKTVLAIAAALAAIALLLVFSSGSCSNAGGGGDAAPVPTNSSKAPSSSASASSGGSPAASDSRSYEQLRDQLKAKLEARASQGGANSRDASASASVQSVAGALAELSQRGFSNLALSASFAIDGTYLGDTVIDQNSSSNEKYPAYKATYISPSKVEWLIAINDGRVYAATGALSGATYRQLVLSETESIVQYNGMSNKYSDVDLNTSSDFVGVVVQRIDKATLDSYTVDKLVSLL